MKLTWKKSRKLNLKWKKPPMPNINLLCEDLRLSTPHFDTMDAAARQQARIDYKQHLLYQALTENRDLIMKEFTPDIFGQTVQIVVGVLHMQFGFGKKRIQRFILELNELGDMMVRGHNTVDELRETIEGETHITFKELFAMCEVESEKMKLAYEKAKKEREQYDKQIGDKKSSSTTTG